MPERALSAYLTARRGDSGAPDSCEAGRRCFTLIYGKAFHLDVLPAIPDGDGSPTGILLTDRYLRALQFSDPKAYAEWFKAQMVAEFIAKRAMLAEAARVEPEQIPDSRVKTTLQRTVQALKHHRNLYFADNLEDPPSILLTTLAHAYAGQQDLFDALLGAAAGMPNFIEREGNSWSVPNPVQPQENFADKWSTHPERAEHFYVWLGQLEVDLRAAAETRGLGRVASRLAEGFGEGPIKRAAERLGTGALETREGGKLGFDRIAGALAVVGPGVAQIKRHDFYGTPSE